MMCPKNISLVGGRCSSDQRESTASFPTSEYLSRNQDPVAYVCGYSGCEYIVENHIKLGDIRLECLVVLAVFMLIPNVHVSGTTFNLTH